MWLEMVKIRLSGAGKDLCGWSWQRFVWLELRRTIGRDVVDDRAAAAPTQVTLPECHITPRLSLNSLFNGKLAGVG